MDAGDKRDEKVKLDERGRPIVKPRGADERAVNPPEERRA